MENTHAARQAAMGEAKELAKRHLKEIAGEIRDWNKTSLLKDDSRLEAVAEVIMKGFSTDVGDATLIAKDVALGLIVEEFANN